MPAFSNYAEGQVLKWLFTASAITRPSTWFLALFTSDPGETGSGTEVSGAGYARKAIGFNGASNPVTGPTAQISFTASGGNWGSVTHWAVYDAVSGGNLLVYGALTTAKTVNDGDTAVAAVDAFSVSLD
jgi:hypothetical protein